MVSWASCSTYGVNALQWPLGWHATRNHAAGPIMSKKNNKRNSRQGKGKSGGRNSGHRRLPETSGRLDAMNGAPVTIRGIGIPRQLFATVRMLQQGYLAVGAAASGTAIIYLNSYFEPFNTSVPLNTGWGFNFTASSATAKVFTPNSFFGAGYESVRVHNARLKVRGVCGTSGDTMEFWMYPAYDTGVAGGITLPESSGSPGFKSMLINSGNPVVNCVSAVRCANVVGMSKVQYETNPQTGALLTATPFQLAGWYVQYATCDGAVTTGQNYFTFEIEYDVEFFQPLTPAS